MTSPAGAARRRSSTSLLVLVAACAAMALALAFGPGASPARAAEPLPACAVGDADAPFGGYPQWRSTFLDTFYRVARSYVPPRLVSTSRAGANGGSEVRRLVVDDLAALVRAARRHGITIHVNDGYRSYHRQRRMWEAEVARVGEAKAALTVARPGHSEHQLGVALDIAGTTGAHDFLASRGWRFGFVVSFPRGERDTSCYRWEPWHVRYVGRERAAAIHASGLVPRAWLWINVVAAAL